MGVSLRQAIAATRRGGTLSVPGVYTGPIHGFLFGDAFEKGLKFAMGQTHVQKHMPDLLEHIVEGRLDGGLCAQCIDAAGLDRVCRLAEGIGPPGIFRVIKCA